MTVLEIKCTVPIVLTEYYPLKSAISYGLFNSAQGILLLYYHINKADTALVNAFSLH
jgi:hypothetical protein